MKKIKHWIYALPLVILLVHTACKKETQTNTPTPVNAKVAKVEVDGFTSEVVYNTNGSINTITVKQSDGTVIDNYVFSYDNGKIKEITYAAKWRYTYIGENIAKIETITNDIVRYQTEFIYNLNGKIAEKNESRVTVTGGILPFMKTVYYYNTDGNVSKREVFDYINHDWMKSENIFITEYDNKPNTSESFITYPYLPASCYSVNNALKEESRDDSYILYLSTVNAYTYDISGKPVSKQTTYHSDGFPDTYSSTKIYY